jgi:hypothetical protein
MQMKLVKNSYPLPVCGRTWGVLKRFQKEWKRWKLSMNGAVGWMSIATWWWHGYRSSKPGSVAKKLGPVVRSPTKEVLSLQPWVLSEGGSHVGMESTGVLWRPVSDRLAGYFELVLVNAAHRRQVPGRKTDVQDADWLADLLQHGLLTPSFVPDHPQQDLRDWTRLRVHLVQDRAQLINGMLTVLHQGGIKLSGVLSDVVGVSGRAILSEIQSGSLCSCTRGSLTNRCTW